MYRLFAIFFSITVLTSGALAAEQESSVVAFFNDQTREQIEELIVSRDSGFVPMTGVTRLLSHGLIAELYQQRDFQPVWLDGWQLKPDADVLMESLRDAGSHGLCGNVYLLAELEGLMMIQKDFTRLNLPLAPENRAALDLLLSQAFLTFATHMIEGQVDPALIHVDWSARRRKANLVKLLEYALDNGRMPAVLEGLYPPHAEYLKLVAVLKHYQEISALGGWPKIPPGPTIRPDDVDDRILILREHLYKTGDMSDFGDGLNRYDGPIVKAVELFQRRHGLVDDGVIGPRTLAALNVSVDERIRQVELNLERWRWMPKNFGERHIRVNVADFRLDVIEDGESVLNMPVIVGTNYRKTPVFSASMTYLEFAPYWTVPPTILREDKLPLIKRNPEYLEEKHFRILSRGTGTEFIDPDTINWQAVKAENFPGLLRMEPGPWNPLGRVKFMFPNRFNVYLHDTNEPGLFSNNVRSFSSGCIRIERPRDLALYLLEGILDADAVDALMAGSEPQQVPIKAMPVHIQYWTAWVDEDGVINFRDDVYFRDLDLEIALTDPAYRVMDQLRASGETQLYRYN